MEKFKQELQSMVVGIKKLLEFIRKEKMFYREEKTKIYILPSDKHLERLHGIILEFHYQILNGKEPYKSFDYYELPRDEWEVFQKLCGEIGLKTKIVEIPHNNVDKATILTIELL